MDLFAVKKVRHRHRWLDEVSICLWNYSIVCEFPTWERPQHSIIPKMSFSLRLREPNFLPFQRTKRRHLRLVFTIPRKPLRSCMIVPNRMCFMSGGRLACEKYRAKKAPLKISSKLRFPVLGHMMFLYQVLMWVKSTARNISLGVIKISLGHLG